MGSEKIIHKSLFLSSVKDNAPPGKRTAYCSIVDNTEVNNKWIHVTCEKCREVENNTKLHRDRKRKHEAYLKRKERLKNE